MHARSASRPLNVPGMIVKVAKRTSHSLTKLGARGRARVRDRKMALNWGAHRPRRHLFKLTLDILRFYPEAQIRRRIL